jgi:hypothetical protein
VFASIGRIQTSKDLKTARHGFTIAIVYTTLPPGLVNDKTAFGYQKNRFFLDG